MTNFMVTEDFPRNKIEGDTRLLNASTGYDDLFK